MNKSRTRGIFYRNGIAYIRYQDEQGSIVKESTRQGTKRFAQQLLELRKTEVAMRINFPNRKFSSVMFKDLLEYWKLNHDFKKSRFQYLLPRIEEEFCQRKAREIESDNIQDFLNRLKKKGLSASSCNHYRTILNGIFGLAVRRKKFGENPVSSVPQMKEPAGRDRLLTREEMGRLFKAIKNNLELWSFVILLFTTAARKSEVLKRKWSEVHFGNPVSHIFVPHTKNGDPKNLILTEPAINALKRLPSFEQSDYLFPSKPTGRFPNPKSPTRHDFGKEFRACCKEAGITDFRIHDLRKILPSILMAHGVSSEVTKKITGHRSVALERYQILREEFMKQTVDIVAEEFTLTRLLSQSVEQQPEQ